MNINRLTSIIISLRLVDEQGYYLDFTKYSINGNLECGGKVVDFSSVQNQIVDNALEIEILPNSLGLGSVKVNYFINYENSDFSSNIQKIANIYNLPLSVVDGSAGNTQMDCLIFDIPIYDIKKVQSSISYKCMAWDELREVMRNNGLEKGAFYEITDYVTCTKAGQEYTSARFPFTIIVQATSTNTLSEDAKCGYSTLTNGNYFSENNANLKAWEIKYCIDNNTNRFSWADSVNGKGVIYYMKDEWGNECPYDFKNIQFVRYPILTMPNGSTDLVYDVDNQKTKYGLKDQSGIIFPLDATIDESNPSFYYTFNAIDSSDNNIYDASIIQIGIINDENGDFIVQNNIIKELYTSINSSEYYYGQVLNLNNICISNVIKDLTHTELSLGCYSNTFGNSCYLNTFGNYCYLNTFGDNCFYNTFGDECNSNTFGNYCYLNTFGDNCFYNTFGDECFYNTFGDNCFSNTFGDNCFSNTFGDECDLNTFGNYCYENTFGNGYVSNTFGNYCYKNNFYHGLFGTTPKDFIRYLTLENGVCNNNFYSNLPTSSTSYLQRIKIKGLEHTTPTDIQITLSSVNTKYEWLVFYLNGGVLKQYCIEDHLTTNDYTDEEKAEVDTIKNKVDKIDGKGLSTNDYTDEEKIEVATIKDKVDKIDGKGLSTNDYTNEDKNKLNTTEQISNKVSVINENSTDAQYPSAKATKKFVEEAKKLLFIDMWNEACGINGRYNEESGFFELININDITYEEALGIFRISNVNPPKNNSYKYMFAGLYQYQYNYRAFIPSRLNLQNTYNINSLYCYCNELREVIINSYKGENIWIVENANSSFCDCYKLTDVFSILNCWKSGVNFAGAFRYCSALRNISIKNLQVDIDFKWSSELSNESILYMITNSNIKEPTTKPFTITLHPDAYARAIADTEIQAALAAQPLITLIS